MPVRHVVVDGSNIATEGRSLPSLAQLDQAVREFLAENPDDTVTVVVDASFAHRIDPSELATFEEAEAAGEVVSPPAGAIGRGDAFLLRIADKIGATVLSNDSFQEFHGEHEWLFERGRLIGGKPVPEVGWIYTPRTPVRGPKSREAVKEAKRKRQPPAGPEGATGLDLAAQRGRGRGKKVERAIATATEEAVAPDESPRRRRRKTGEPPADPVNEPLAFITFIAAHPLGTEVTGVVDSFSSHGAFVDADGARCYVPLSGIGDPPPRSAREVLGKKGDEHVFAVQALDPLRRGVELALPAFAHVAGGPTEETVEAEIEPRPRRGREPAAKPQVGAKRTAPSTAKKAAARKAPSGSPAA
ncbi:MAG: NYN domain-containing protein, partial [Acidimicrobiales bacterium]